MNYSEMSGYEINNRLHNAIACDGKYDLKVEGYKVTWTEKSTGRVIETLRKQYDKEFKDYLSSWADAGPIILSSLISIDPNYKFTDDTEETLAPTGTWRAEHIEKDGRIFRSSDKNPLRAAMIVFLMMQEANNA